MSLGLTSFAAACADEIWWDCRQLQHSSVLVLVLVLVRVLVVAAAVVGAVAVAEHVPSSRRRRSVAYVEKG